MQEDDNLKDFLGDDEDSVTGEEQEPDQVEEEPKAEEPQEEPTPEPEEETGTPPGEPEEWTKAAVMDERRKRQELQQQVDDLRRQMEAKPSEPVRPEPLPDPLEDSEAHAAALETRVNQMVNNRFLNMSKAMHKAQKGDVVDEAEKAYGAAAQSDPSLWASLNSAPDPYGHVVDWYEKKQAMAEIGDPREYAARVKADAEKGYAAKLAELQAEIESLKSASALPGSLAGATSKGKTSVPEWGGPDSLDDILG